MGLLHLAQRAQVGHAGPPMYAAEAEHVATAVQESALAMVVVGTFTMGWQGGTRGRRQKMEVL